MDKIKKIKTIVVLFSLICISSIFHIGYKNAESKKDKIITPEFEELQKKDEINEGISKGIEVPGYSEIAIKSGEKNIKVDFFNPEANNVYFKIKLVLNDSNEVIYESKMFSPGQHLYEIELNRPIEKGIYDMTIIYETFSMDGNYTPKNGANVSCKLKAD